MTQFATDNFFAKYSGSYSEANNYYAGSNFKTSLMVEAMILYIYAMMRWDHQVTGLKTITLTSPIN